MMMNGKIFASFFSRDTQHGPDSEAEYVILIQSVTYKAKSLDTTIPQLKGLDVISKCKWSFCQGLK